MYTVHYLIVMLGSRNLCKAIRACDLSHGIIAKQYRPTCMPAVNTRLIHTTRLQNAGHSHWDNIKHIKSAKDQARSKVFSGLSRRIVSTIKGQLVCLFGFSRVDFIDKNITSYGYHGSTS